MMPTDHLIDVGRPDSVPREILPWELYDCRSLEPATTQRVFFQQARYSAGDALRAWANTAAITNMDYAGQIHAAHTFQVRALRLFFDAPTARERPRAFASLGDLWRYGTLDLDILNKRYLSVPLWRGARDLPSWVTRWVFKPRFGLLIPGQTHFRASITWEAGVVKRPLLARVVLCGRLARPLQ